MEKRSPNESKLFSRQIEEKANRKLRAQKENKRSVWLGLGMFGMIGWSVSIPTVLGAVVGLWLDKQYPQTFSWTLTFLLTGLIVGSIIAWNWVVKEDDEMHGNKLK